MYYRECLALQHLHCTFFIDLHSSDLSETAPLLYLLGMPRNLRNFPGLEIQLNFTVVDLTQIKLTLQLCNHVKLTTKQ